MMKKYFLNFIGIISLLMINTVMLAATMQATVDQSNVVAGQPIILSIKLPKSMLIATRPDLSLLSKDFDVLGIASSSSMQIINGQSSTSARWDIKIVPKKIGELTIPPVYVQNYSSNSVAIHVSPATPQATTQPSIAAKTTTDQPIYMQVSVDKTTPYVNSEVTYNVKIYVGIPLLNANLSLPEVDGNMLKPLGPSKRYQQMVNGQQYVVIEQNFSLFPQQAGKTVIRAPQLQADVIANDRYGMMGMPKTMQVTTNPLTLNVKALPAVAKNSLSAQSVSLNQTWSANTWKVGEPITRTITLKTVGVPTNLLPSLTMSNSPMWNSYPDKPIIQTDLSDQGVISTVKQKIVLIPSQAGTVTIPAINIPWFNTMTGQTKTASLIASTFTVEPAANSVTLQNKAPAMMPMSVASTPATPTTATPAISLKPMHPLSTTYWLWIVSVLTMLWLLTMFFWWRQRKQVTQLVALGPQGSHLSDDKLLDKKQAWHQVQSACHSNDARVIKFAILDWANKEWPEKHYRQLSQVSQQLQSPELHKLLLDLDQSLYGKTQSDWQHGAEIFTALKMALKKNRQSKKVVKSDDGLPPLYPE